MLNRFTKWLEGNALRGKAKCLLADGVFLTLGRVLAHRYKPAPSPAWEGMFTNDAVADADNVVLTTSCPRYFEAFHEALLRSARLHSPGTLVHFHVIGISAGEAEECWQRLLQCAGRHPLALSWQGTPAGLSEQVLPAYYQNARYLLARQVLETWRRPLFVMDIDVELLAPLEKALALAQGRDVCLTFRPRECPSRRYLAGFSLFADTERARAFLGKYEELFRKYSGLLFFPKFDQRLLYLCAGMAGDSCGRFSFSEIIATTMKPDDAGRLVLCPKGAAKWRREAA